MISRADLQESCDYNPDGFGWSIMTPDMIITDWSMNAKEAIDDFLQTRADFPDMAAMFHARIATHGTVNIHNCHPFKVENELTYMGHNGILPIQSDGVRSDTKILAEDWLPEFGIEMLDDEDFVQELEHFARGSKLVFLSLDPRLSKYAYIINEQDGHWVKDGLGERWYSNYSYVPASNYSRYSGWSWAEAARTSKYPTQAELFQAYDHGYIWCETCDDWTLEDSGVDGRCHWCLQCSWCGSDPTDCDCHDDDERGLTPLDEQSFDPAMLEIVSEDRREWQRWRDRELALADSADDERNY